MAIIKNGIARIKVISPGIGSSGYYSPELLEKAVAKFTDAQCYWDHPTATEESDRPERSLRDLAGNIQGTPKWDANGVDGPGIYADVRVFSPYQEAVEELAPHIGMSIRASGRANMGEVAGKQMPVIRSIEAVQSVDFVTRAGRDGKILQLFEAARPHTTPLQETQDMGRIEDLEKQVADLLADNARLREAADVRTAEAARLRESDVLRHTREVATRELLSNDELLPMTRDRLFAEAIKNPPIVDGALDEVAFREKIADLARIELAYLAGTSGTGRITGMGGAPRKELTEADVQQELAGVFSTIGLSESGAALAARGRR